MARWYLDVAEATEGAALRRHGTIVAALAESEKLLALLESQLETMADQKVRAATSVATLATFACRGIGPTYVSYGRTPLYRLSDALVWAHARLAAPRKATFDVKAATEAHSA